MKRVIVCTLAAVLLCGLLASCQRLNFPARGRGRDGGGGSEASIAESRATESREMTPGEAAGRGRKGAARGAGNGQGNGPGNDQGNGSGQASPPPAQPAEEEPVSPKAYVSYADDVPSKYAPRLILHPDGDFHLVVNLYEGMGNVYGSYSADGSTLSMSVTSRDFSGFLGDNVNSFTFTVEGEGLIYSGDAIGMTDGGDRFELA